MHITLVLAHSIYSINIIQRSIEFRAIVRATLLMFTQGNVKQRRSFIQQIFLENIIHSRQK